MALRFLAWELLLIISRLCQVYERELPPKDMSIPKRDLKSRMLGEFLPGRKQPSSCLFRCSNFSITFQNYHSNTTAHHLQISPLSHKPSPSSLPHLTNSFIPKSPVPSPFHLAISPNGLSLEQLLRMGKDKGKGKEKG